MGREHVQRTGGDPVGVGSGVRAVTGREQAAVTRWEWAAPGGPGALDRLRRTPTA
ncbi:hypothetical protein [Streptomyces chartreusis]